MRSGFWDRFIKEIILFLLNQEASDHFKARKPFCFLYYLYFYLHPVLKYKPDIIPAVDRHIVHQCIPCPFVKTIHHFRHSFQRIHEILHRFPFSAQPYVPLFSKNILRRMPPANAAEDFPVKDNAAIGKDGDAFD